MSRVICYSLASSWPLTLHVHLEKTRLRRETVVGSHIPIITAVFNCTFHLYFSTSPSVLVESFSNRLYTTAVESIRRTVTSAQLRAKPKLTS